MNMVSNSLFCSPEISLVKLYLKQATRRSKCNSLKDLDANETASLVNEFVLPVFKHIVEEYGEQDECDHVFMRLHGWFFTSWMITKLGYHQSQMFHPIGTQFYKEILKSCGILKFAIQCFSNLNIEIVETLVNDLAKCCREHEVTDDSCLLLQLIDCCLSFLGNMSDESCLISSTKLCHIVIQLSKHFEEKYWMHKILEKLSERVKKLVQLLKSLKKEPDRIFEKELSIVTFDETVSAFSTQVENLIISGNHSVSKNDPIGNRRVEDLLQDNTVKLPAVTHCNKYDALLQAIGALLKCLNDLFFAEECKLKSSHLLEFTIDNEVTIEGGFAKGNFHNILIDLYITCQFIAALPKNNELTFCKSEPQKLAQVLEPYFQKYANPDAKSSLNDMINDQHIAVDTMNEAGMIAGTLEEKFQYALHQIMEFHGSEACFEWLLTEEELFTDKRWLQCIETHAKTYASIRTTRMFLDILALFQELDTNEERYAHIYSTLKKVVLELVAILTLPEQKEVVFYNFELICSHFHSYKNSFYLRSETKSDEMFVLDHLTSVLNKLTDCSSRCFSKDVIDNIIQGCLMSPYLTLLHLLKKAAIQSGYEKVTCKILHLIPWLVELRGIDNDTIVFQVLSDLMTSFTSTSEKRLEQFVKMMEALIMTYDDAQLIAPSEVIMRLVLPEICFDDDEEEKVISFDVLLRVLKKCLASSLVLVDDEILCNIEEENLFQLLFILLRHYQHIEWYWDEFIREIGTRSDDDIVEENFQDMIQILNIIEEYLLPYLIKSVNRNPCLPRHFMSSVQGKLDELDWYTPLLITPLLKHQLFTGFHIKPPKSIMHFVSAHLNVKEESNGVKKPFWEIYFRSCLHGDVVEIFSSKIHDLEKGNTADIINALAKILPFKNLKHWKYELKISQQMIQFGYLNLPDEWKRNLTCKLCGDWTSNIVVKTSELLLLILDDISRCEWMSSFLWISTLRNYASMMKMLSTAISDQAERSKMLYYLLTHLIFITFNIIPENLQDINTIAILDIFKQYLSCHESEDIHEIINTIPRNQLRITMENTVSQITS